MQSTARTCLAAIVLAAVAFLTAPLPAGACDLCAIYMGSLMQQDKTGPLAGVSEQYTDLGSIRMGEKHVANPADEWLKSSITQLVVGYSITPRVGVQVNIPLISREYRRLENGAPVHGDVGGLGDVSVLARYSPLSREVGGALVHVELLAGLKTPTGDSDFLAEELPDRSTARAGGSGAAAVDTSRSARTAHAPPAGGRHHEDEANPSAVHGHDLALGSGSVDGVFGASFHASWQRLFGELALQYVVRGNGDFAYEYADDFTWETGPGLYVVARNEWTGSIRAALSGEYKGRDRQQGLTAGDTAITAVYLGPGLVLTWSDALHADLAVDLPVFQDVSDRQIVANYRLRAGMVWRF